MLKLMDTPLRAESLKGTGVGGPATPLRSPHQHLGQGEEDILVVRLTR